MSIFKKVDEKFAEKSAREFSEAIESQKLYEELRSKEDADSSPDRNKDNRKK